MIEKIKKVTPLISRGPMPQTQSDINYIAENFDDILNLESGFSEFVRGLVNHEVEMVMDTDLGWYHIIMSNILPPTIDELNACIKLINRKRKVFVHCHEGVDRTGMTIAAYRIAVEKWTVEAATKEMYEMGFHRFPLFLWPKRLKQFAKSLNG